MFVLALSLYNTWNRGVFLLCKITNLLIYRYGNISKRPIIVQSSTRMFVSKNWFVINGNLYAKKYIKDLRYVFPGTRNNTIWITYYNNKRLTLPFSSIDLSGDNGEEMKRILNKIMRGDQSIVVNAK